MLPGIQTRILPFRTVRGETVRCARRGEGRRNHAPEREPGQRKPRPPRRRGLEPPDRGDLGPGDRGLQVRRANHRGAGDPDLGAAGGDLPGDVPGAQGQGDALTHPAGNQDTGQTSGQYRFQGNIALHRVSLIIPNRRGSEMSARNTVCYASCKTVYTILYYTLQCLNLYSVGWSEPVEKEDKNSILEI